MLLILLCNKETQYSEFRGPGFSSISPDRKTSKEIITAVYKLHRESCKKVPTRYMPLERNEKLTYQ